MFKYTHTRLLVPNFDDCFEFYKETMNFPVRMGAKGEVYAEFDTGNTVIALFDRNAMAEAIMDSREDGDVMDRMVLTFEVEDLDASFELLKAKGAEVAAEPKNREAWMIRTAHFRDPAGNLIELNANL